MKFPLISLAALRAASAFGGLQDDLNSMGSCPQLENTMHHRGEKLEPLRLHGLWKIVYDHEDRTKDMDCFTLKFDKDAEGLNQTQLQVLVGHRYAEFTESAETFVYDDDAFFTFNHPENTAVAAVQTKEELNDPDNKQIMQRLKDELTPLTDEQKSNMTEEDIEQHEQNREMLESMKDQIMERINRASPYENAWQVLDTDYENYLIQYACQEIVEQVNAAGQSQQEIEMLKYEDASQEYDEKFVKNQTKHTIMATVQTRTINPDVLTKDKIDTYVAKLKDMVKSHNFDGHKVLTHGADCPAESVDVFSLPTSKRYSELNSEGFYDDVEGEEPEGGEVINLEDEGAEQGEQHETDEL